MKIKDGFVLREVAGSYVAIATGEAGKNFCGMIRMNATGAKIWECFKDGLDIDQTSVKLSEIYDADIETIRTEVSRIAEQLISAGIALTEE